MLFSLMCGLFITGIDLVMGFVVEQLLSSGA
jgi:hypothetical protein